MNNHIDRLVLSSQRNNAFLSERYVSEWNITYVLQKKKIICKTKLDAYKLITVLIQFSQDLYKFNRFTYFQKHLVYD